MGVYSRHMETLSHEPQPIVSIVEQKKLEAAELTSRKIQELIDGGKSKVEAAKDVYESVKGHEYYEEQALAKLLEYFNLQKELDNRAVEIGTKYGAYTVLLDGAVEVPAVNDSKYTVV